MSSENSSAHLRWPLLVVGFLALSVGFNVYLMAKARGDRAFAVESDYYQKAMHWDERVQREADSQALGWTVSVDLVPGRSAPALTFTVRDRDGRPVEGATGTVRARHNARANDVLQSAVSPREPGVYGAELEMKRMGLWEIELALERGTEKFQTIVRRDLEAGG